MRTRPRWLIGIALLAACLGAGAAEHVAGQDPRAKTVVKDGAWCWFADPRAIRHEDQTFVGYVTSTGDVNVSALDHKTNAVATATLHRRLNKDDHANPGILLRDDGRLMVFYSAHSRSPMYYRVSKQPCDIGEWEKERRLGTNVGGGNGHTYANPVQLSAEDNRIYLFWRGGNWQPCMSWTDDRGKTWAKARWMIRAPRRTPPYVKVETDGEDEIHLAYTDGHPRHMAENNIYYACYRAGVFHKADGTKITTIDKLPFKTSDGDKVYDAKKHKARGWIWDIALDDGKPVVVFAAMPTRNDHRYRYARWDGEAWQHHRITKAGPFIAHPREYHYSGGVYLDHADPNVVYLSRQVDGHWDVERWETDDGGRTWASKKLATGDKTTKNIRPVTPRNAKPGELNVLWMQGRYDYWTRYKTRLVAWPIE
ncbi:MAG: BNR-4 repeat-containing protein [Planctomycetota bacterium]